ncbi:MAG: isoprenylcysteine carboxylmethyltransferase family protein [Nanoarchaeota archaeon]
MKFKSFLFVSSILLVFFILLPYAAVTLNDMVSLPNYSNPRMRFFGIFFFILGIANFFYCTSLFSKFGNGTPIPTEPTKKFFAEGSYKYVRNPIYLGHLSVFLSYFLFFGHILLLFYLLILVIILHFYVVFEEESKLKKRFGREYIRYMKKVPRWLPKF